MLQLGADAEDLVDGIGPDPGAVHHDAGAGREVARGDSVAKVEPPQSFLGHELTARKFGVIERDARGRPVRRDPAQHEPTVRCAQHGFLETKRLGPARQRRRFGQLV